MVLAEIGDVGVEGVRGHLVRRDVELPELLRRYHKVPVLLREALQFEGVLPPALLRYVSHVPDAVFPVPLLGVRVALKRVPLEDKEIRVIHIAVEPHHGELQDLPGLVEPDPVDS